MSKMHMRKIVVDHAAYLWRFNPRYEKDAGGLWRCHDTFVAYPVANKRSALRVHFVTWESPVVGGPLRTGAPLDPASGGFNLHQPRFAAEFIRQGIARGWQPEGTQSLVIEDGVGLLREIGMG